MMLRPQVINHHWLSDGDGLLVRLEEEARYLLHTSLIIDIVYSKVLQ